MTTICGVRRWRESETKNKDFLDSQQGSEGRSNTTGRSRVYFRDHEKNIILRLWDKDMENGMDGAEKVRMQVWTVSPDDQTQVSMYREGRGNSDWLHWQRVGLYSA